MESACLFAGLTSQPGNKWVLSKYNVINENQKNLVNKFETYC